MAAPSSDLAGWLRAGHTLGRGCFRAENVARDGGRTLLALPVGTFDGGQIASPERYARGRFHARLRTADAPGSVTAFFLYEDVPGEANDEADVEIFNDGSGRALLTTWRHGVQTRSEDVRLGFDPSAAAHDYAIELDAAEIRFLVDEALLARWSDGLPTRPMRVMASAWWPSWLRGPAPADTRYSTIEQISIDAEPARTGAERWRITAATPHLLLDGKLG
ncbi:MAG TPA: family 16 glycosylhydrolase [Longimicrobiaceae bacterium]|jgi:beta-glucanase (GH16 family)|nr:family 16 glycosylhydrolase [Longimicrobiaceae bacterium]